MSNVKKLALVPAQLFGTAEILSVPASQLDDDELIVVWSMLDIMEKFLVKERKGELKVEMFERAAERGAKNDKGSFEWKLDDGKITKQKRQAKSTIEPALVQAKLGHDPIVAQRVLRDSVNFTREERKALLDILSASDHTMVFQLVKAVRNGTVGADTKAFEGLVAAGVISEEDAASVTSEGKVTWALTVSKPKALKPLQDEIKRAMAQRKELEDD